MRRETDAVATAGASSVLAAHARSAVRAAARVSFLLSALVVCTSSSRAFQTVHVVNGGTGGALQTVIDAAVDGDTILVHSGSFDACQIVGKSLTIVSEPDQSTQLKGLRVSGTTLSQRTTIAGLRIVAPPAVSGGNSAPECIVLDQCAGSVRLENVLASLQVPNGNPALRTTSCSDVALVACTLEGSDGASATFWIPGMTPGAGVDSVQSRIAAYDTTAVGGDGNDGHLTDVCTNPFDWQPTAGAPGVAIDSASTWYSSAGVIRGGEGGHGINAHCSCFTGQVVPGTNGRNGGAAIENDAGSAVHLIGPSLQGGAGGLGGNPTSCGGGPAGAGAPGSAGPTSTNTVNVLPGTPLRLNAPTRVRAGEMLPLTVWGNPGDVVILTRSFEARWVLVLPLRGVLVSGPMYRRVTLGTIPGSGTFSPSVTTGTLSGGVQAVQWHLQIFGIDSRGAQRVGGPFVGTILDPSF